MTSLDRTALVLVIVGALNWLLVGMARYDLVAAIFNGQASPISRAIYTVIGLAGIWTISLLLRPHAKVQE